MVSENLTICLLLKEQLCMPGGPCQLENELVDAAGQTGEPTHPKLKVALSGKKKKKKHLSPN